MDVSLTDIASRLRAADSALLVAHVNPDADALGSSLAVAVALEALGVDAQVSFPDDPFEVPLALRFLPRQDLIVAPEQAIPADLVMSMDASSGDRIGRLLAVGESAPAFIAVDHHASFVPFAPMVHADATRPATGLLALEIIDALGVDLTPDMALCLYAAISSDTGSFRFASTTPESMRAAARLMETGIDFAGAAKAMFDTKSRDFLRLQAEVMGDLEVLTAGGVAVAVIRVSRQDRDRHGIAFTQVESLIDAVRTVEGVEVAVVLKQDDHGLWRVSSRSLGAVDVGRACTSQGGGGHVMAAGFTGTTDAQQTLQGFLDALELD
ncbi:MAG: bifunctional oligoribonuclease/PAP phosphatase NrnA [Actinobacteria bacterium]|jgi:phosphoesterase RecJ-like protein|nr:bifunctional oligoribonuclease/PAP phosphatase NrnA [Actinomycetota bacterium]HRY09976.1 bifunctional oligoribonuclease/PAP phosphatase NrnA [Candidatus Nanopelagicales bacterium]MCB9415013.1 bifunctional oligoribonuclease/PAP phosphatase NrnA [Actinomycetota bacterium]TXH32298.1 MAG: bifunctional oligoribonuclease/PAP phosphatase NrnA [Actinomycetota bacterium]HNE89758.1 bifunctional oligoribonuclease/PAP phosphatase NrnA [Actinomycetota bacterium]